jgi:cyclic-di-GMP-binding protein
MAIQTSPISKSGLLFFFDARSCKDWLKTIPLTNVAQAQQRLLDALRILNRSSEFRPLERLTCMELLRDKVAYLLSEQRKRYVGKTVPLANPEQAAWNVSNALLTEMESGYRRCYQDAQAADAPLTPHAALIIQRIMRYMGLTMLMAGFIYRRFESSLWMRLHLQWIEAESRGITSTKVKDSVGSADGYSSVAQAYTAILLGQLANVHELGAREVDFVDAVLKRFGHKAAIRSSQVTVETTTQGLVLGVDLMANAGAAFHLPHVTPDGALDANHTHVRLLDMAELSKSLRRRAKKLAEGELPGNVDLPADWSSAQAYAQLSRLHKLWCDGGSARLAATVPLETDANIAFGITETHFFLSGDLFEQPGVKRDMTRQEMNDIAMFGKVSEATTRARYAEFNYGAQTWPVVDEARGVLRLMRPPNSGRGVAIGALVGVRLGKLGEFYLASVRELVEETANHIIVTLALMPGRPEATAIRASDNKARTATFTQGFRLPPMPAMNTPETLIVPADFAQRARGIDIFHPAHGSAKQVTVNEFVERGLDFDRITISG